MADGKQNFVELLDSYGDRNFRLGELANEPSAAEYDGVYRQATVIEERILDIHNQLVTTLEAVRRWNLKSSDGGAGGHVMPSDLVALINAAIEVAS